MGPWEGWSVTPFSVRELWQLIGAAAFEFGSQTKFAWRGLADSDFKVISTLARELGGEKKPLTEALVRQREMEILHVARSWDIGLSEHGSVTDMHLLAMLQHHGAPTRLIDITYNPLTALWFACSDQERMDRPGVLVALTISDKDMKLSSEVPPLTWALSDDPGAAGLVEAMAESRRTGRNVVVEPRPKDPRMTVQEGAFITSYWPNELQEGPVVGLQYPYIARMMPWVLSKVNNQITSVEGDAGERLAFTGIIVSPRLKRELLPVLSRTFNRSHRTMYPDLPGFVDAVKNNRLADEFAALRSDDGAALPDLPKYWED